MIRKKLVAWILNKILIALIIKKDYSYVQLAYLEYYEIMDDSNRHKTAIIDKILLL